MLGSTGRYTPFYGAIHSKESNYVLKIGLNFGAHRYGVTQTC